MNRLWGTPLFVHLLCWGALALGACASEMAGELGDSCQAPTDCVSERCATDGGAAYCTVECGSNADCAMGSRTLFCSPDGMCEAPCVEGRTEDYAGGRYLCRMGEYEACAGLEPASACEACGCEAFGGGVCVDGVGCVTPQPDGSACSGDYECTEGRCADGICEAPRAMGEACADDEDCATRNCSTDGRAGVMGVCNQELGTSCRDGSTTCSRCIFGRSSFNGEGICSRENCDPINAPNCPSLRGGRRWTCHPTTEGTHACFEVCDDDDVLYSCFRARNNCRNGFCQ